MTITPYIIANHFTRLVGELRQEQTRRRLRSQICLLRGQIRSIARQLTSIIPITAQSQCVSVIDQNDPGGRNLSCFSSKVWGSFPTKSGVEH